MTFRKMIWCLPAVFAPHIAEEYVGGFPGWATHVLGGSFNYVLFDINNAVFMAILLGLTAWVSLKPSKPGIFLLLAWSSGNIFWDFLVHLSTTVALDRYSPGLLTAVLLYFPVSYFVGRAALRDKAIGVMGLACAYAVGLALIAFVIWQGLFHFAGLPR